MKPATICFLMRPNQIMLALIHYPDGLEKWNGVGGVTEEGETPKQGVIREIKEEIGVDVTEDNLKKEHEFEDGGYHLTVFITYIWEGNPGLMEESLKEIKWFNFDQIPYDQMFAGNKEWLSQILYARRESNPRPSD